MLLSQTAEYALRAVIYLADCDGQSQTTQQLAEATQVPSGYLAKVLQGLGRSGLVVAQRGLHGGFSLVKKPSELTVLDVVNAVDPIERITCCPLEIEDHDGTLCPLHQKLDDAMAQVEQTFGESSLAELLKNSDRQQPLCGVMGKKRKPDAS